ncbi:MAG: ABC transporter ATP-binding protein [Syntrophobacter sp.]
MRTAMRKIAPPEESAARRGANLTVLPLLSVRNVSKNFGGVAALNGLNITIKRGEILGLIGPNGSGKTTFFNVVSGIYAPTTGGLVLDGQDISGLSPQKVCRAGVARTFQRSRLCSSLSIFDNIAIGNHKNLNGGLWFNIFNRKKLREQFAQHFETARDLLGAFAPHLSGRMFEGVSGIPMIDRRRIEICRALISRPKLLLLDEPSAGMTRDETRRFMDDILTVRHEMGDITTIIIEHEMDVIEQITDRCAVLNYGEKICEGTFAEVAGNEMVQKAYLGA